MAFSLNSLKPAVRVEYVKAQGCPILWPGVVKKAADSGETSVDLLTNVVFFLHHPERNFRAIAAGETALAEQWKSFRVLVTAMLPNLNLKSPAKPEQVPDVEPSSDTPVRVTEWEMNQNKTRWFRSSSGTLNGVLLKQGMRMNSTDGKRTILFVSIIAGTYGDVIFARDPGKAGFWNGGVADKGGVFRQKAHTFISDITFGEIDQILGQSAKMMVIARVEMMLVMGFLSSAVGATAAGVKTGYDVGQKLAWIAANRTKIEAWITALWALHKASSQLKNLTPVFHNFLMTAIFKVVVSKIPATVANDKEFLYEALADAIGSAGEELVQGKMKLTEELFKLLLQLMKSAFYEAGKFTVAQLEADADKVIAEVRKQNVLLTKPQAKELILEVTTNRVTLQAMFEDLSIKFRAAADA